MPRPGIGAPADAANPWISWDYVTSHLDDLAAAGREHVLLTVSAVLLALLVAFPLAMLVRRYRVLMGPALGIAGVMYTIPSLALISLLWPVFGLSPLTVVLALAVYALLVVLRNTVVGLDGVDPTVVDAARGMGMDRRGILWRVEVPLALPAILAGIRIATVSTVGLVTIGALVGYGGFGSLILSGFQQNFWHAQIFTATAACVLLAVLFEVGLHWLQRRSEPWGRERAR
ncbi:MAG: ABC transporter permease [Candidatus Nanopelagicales bacterium]|nr:ABC transporter permease [Candidatus Nanopelagicales bacterium]